MSVKARLHNRGWSGLPSHRTFARVRARARFHLIGRYRIIDFGELNKGLFAIMPSPNFTN